MKKLACFAFSLVFALSLLSLFGGCGEETSGHSELEAQIAELRAELDAVILLNQYLTISSGTVNGLVGPHVILEGVNLHIRNGSGATTMINGVGNLVVGYNEGPTTLIPGDRGGSHNLIVGPEHKYLSFGGFVAGFRNTVSGGSSSVNGGSDNTASGSSSSVSGGWSNTASGGGSSVSGGGYNTASDLASSVSGGYKNEASGNHSSVSGGFLNEASGPESSVSGGIGKSVSVNYDWAACDCNCAGCAP